MQDESSKVSILVWITQGLQKISNSFLSPICTTSTWRHQEQDNADPMMISFLSLPLSQPVALDRQPPTTLQILMTESKRTKNIGATVTCIGKSCL